MKKEIITETIKLKLENVSEAYSQFSVDENKVLNSEVSDFLDQNLKGIKKNEKIDLQIKLCANATDEEKQDLKRTIKKSYNNKISELNETIGRQTIVSLILLTIGILFIVALNFLDKLKTPYIITIILEIVAWVFVWEFVDIFVFARSVNHLKVRRYAKMAESKIEFLEK